MVSNLPQTTTSAVAELTAWLRSHGPVAVVTGAGVSTASGIPDYRDGDGQWKRRRQPVTHQQFVESLAVRRRYWARSYAGWAHFSGARPNVAHAALAELERRGWITGLVTQNVDGLHQRAGSRHVVDLHGRLDIVICLQCGTRFEREWLQQSLAALNPGWADHAARIAPDGDADLEGADFPAFEVLDCPHCGGVLKPDVVFFGGSVPAAVREAATRIVMDAPGVLVVGSSLMVWSGFRLIRAASEHDISIAAVNQGRTRADDLLSVKCVGEGGRILPQVVDAFDEAT